MNGTAIKIENVSKSYKLYNSPGDRFKEALNPFRKIYHKEFYALRNINLEVKQGEILGVVGKNGSGKSTLLKLISSVLVPNNGNVKVNGKISALLELGSGLNPEFTGLQNVFFYGTILGITRDEMKKKLESILAFADIGEFIHQQLKTYSSGMRARLGFALAVSVDPDILIVDEVLAVGDLSFRRKCYGKIQELFSNGKTVILVSHNSQAIAQYCSRAILIKEGEIAHDDKPRVVLALYEQYIFSRPASEKRLKEESGRKKTEDHDHDSFIENLNVNPVQTNENMARIYDACVRNSDGKIVNLLVRDNVYTVEFKAEYFHRFKHVSLGVQIKDMKGFLISGANLLDYQQQLVSQVSKGDIVKVRWSFKCLLVPGLYTITLSSMSESIKDSIRLTDALMFKVQPDKNVNGGVVGLEQKITVEEVKMATPLELESYCNDINPA